LLPKEVLLITENGVQRFYNIAFHGVVCIDGENKNGVALYRTRLQSLTVRLYCLRRRLMAASGGGALLGIPFEITQGISVPRLSLEQCGVEVYRGTLYQALTVHAL
jgi:hypothetical protein